MYPSMNKDCTSWQGCVHWGGGIGEGAEVFLLIFENFRIVAPSLGHFQLFIQFVVKEFMWERKEKGWEW